MIANRREKIIALVLIGALGILAFDQYALTPYFDARKNVSADLEAATTRERKASRLLNNQARVERAWRELLAGPLKTDPAAAESQALHAVRDWAQNSRVDLQSLKPERIGRTGDFQQIRVQATGTGTTAAVSALLSQVESAKIPMRVNELRLTSRKEGTDDLSFSLSVSTVLFSPAPEKTPGARTATPAKGEAK